MRINQEILNKFNDSQEVKQYRNILKKKRINLFIKRVFDIILSLILIILFCPIMIIIALIIKLDSKGPVFYRQVRVTKNGKLFRIFKFRTMVNNADKIGTLVTTNNDARVTRVGKFLRKYRIDEISQVLNVFWGTMSFVGTRPEVEKYVLEYSSEMMASLLLPAGVTSLASIKFKDEDELLNASECVDKTYIEDILPKKMNYNLEYIAKYNFFKDIKIMILTAIAVIR